MSQTEIVDLEEPKKKTRVSNTKVETPKAESDDSTEEKADELTLGVFKLNPSANIPLFATKESACFDLAACFDQGSKIKCITTAQEGFRRATDLGIAIHPGDRFLIPTGLAFDIPQGYCLEIYPRSGLSFTHGLSLSNCTAIIDSDYVKETFISINNIGSTSKYIKNGERIAQAKLVKLSSEVKIEELTVQPQQKTDRNGGFGSTGKG